ncbi:MAG: aldehyde ferredoxin oxidoreductase family protein [Syntrophales bacterium]
MLYGYQGKLLHIDLTKEESKTIPLPEEILKKYLGGRGLGAKLYWDLIPPGTDPLSPQNVLMVLTGPVGGALVPGSGKHVIVTKSPASGGWLDTYSSGRMTAEMKFAGYDGLIVTGRASRPVFIFIEDDRVEIRDAGPFWGKGSFETETYLKESFHPECGEMCIGPAGENLVKYACINSEYFRQAGRGGAGAVMGSKNLKGIAVKGSGGIRCADMPRIFELIQEHYQIFKVSPIGIARHRYGTPLTLNITHAAGMLPTRNYSTGRFERGIGTIDKDGVANATTSDRACYGCPFCGCSKFVEVKEGPYKGTKLEGPEYETIGLLGSNLDVDYLPSIIKANYLCDDLGMDTISAGNVIGFVMECMKKGLLTEKETNGLDLRFGNYQAGVDLLELIAFRKGFGDFCADGVRDMAKSLGKGSEDFAMHAKGLEFPAYDPRAGWGSTITYATTARGGCHRRAWPPMKEVLGGVYPFTTEGKARMVKGLMDDNCVMHSLLVCDFQGKFIPLETSHFRDYFHAVTGWDYSVQDLYDRAEMIEILVRQINTREGFTAADDRLPKRIVEESHPEGPTKDRVIGTENFEKMKQEFYAVEGWDAKGVPTPESIDRLKLDEDVRFTL